MYYSVVCFWEIRRSFSKLWEWGRWSFNENKVKIEKRKCNIFYLIVSCGYVDGCFLRESRIVERVSCRCETNGIFSWIFFLVLFRWSKDVL